MRARCADTSGVHYPGYGDRGIRVCERWQTSFAEFYKDMGPTWFDGARLDRKDVNGNYEPGNCRWATVQQQSRNKRNTVWLQTPDGPMVRCDALQKWSRWRTQTFARIPGPDAPGDHG